MEEKASSGRLKKGRPAVPEGSRRSKKIDARFTEAEYARILALEKALGISKTEIIRVRALSGTTQLVINAREMIFQLDHIGAELARVGNNINQLAKYANTLQKRGMLSEQIVERFNLLFQQHIKIQLDLETALRKIIRQLSK
ncbi:plasmid mobilization protein [Pedobacter nyackensis]|uniref:plasmid mobilization protein n=1 Tax=Pedobacter nyackensis TaxID=475255 RepID=UPI00292CB879|nr:plasmid mobilization relaxosome protein MobC [Pedobacter nyackensis]